MSVANSPEALVHARAWQVTGRWIQFRAEGRINSLRLAGIAVFYLIHLFHYLEVTGHFPSFGIFQISAAEEGVVDDYHLQVTLLALAWTGLALFVHLCLLQPYYPRWLGPLVTVADVILLTAVLYVSAGPRSPLVAVYFLLLTLAAIRCDIWIVQLATIAASLGYLALLASARWPAVFGHVGWEQTVPRYQQLITLATIVLTGICLGQLLRSLPLTAESYRQQVKCGETP